MAVDTTFQTYSLDNISKCVNSDLEGVTDPRSSSYLVMAAPAGVFVATALPVIGVCTHDSLR